MTEDLSPDAFVDDVAADRRGDRALLYEAESPDEAALVQAAKAYGAGLKSRRADLDRRPTRTVLPFNSESKRMSVIERDPIRREVVLYILQGSRRCDRSEPTCIAAVDVRKYLSNVSTSRVTQQANRYVF